MKKLIIFLTSFFVFSLSVNAAPTLDDYTIMDESSVLIKRDSSRFYPTGYNRNLTFVTFFLSEDSDYKQGYIDYYAKASFCFDGDITSFYGSGASDVNMIKTSKKCKYANSSYEGGRVLDVYYKSSFAKGTGSTATITYYSVTNFSIQLIGYSTQSQPFDQSESIDTNIEQNETIINQNNEAENTRKGILGTLQNVFSSIGNLPSLIWNFLKQGFDAITNGLSSLGNTIGGFFENLLSGIIEGLKSLFVPTDDQLYEIVDDASKLSENFGFIGESVSFFINIFTALLGMVNANGCIELPEFTIGSTSLFDSFTFWNAQNVCLGDNAILSANINTIRTITSIALVCLFLNFASSKFFSILSKNDSGEVIDEASDGSVSVNSWSVTNGTRYNRRS